VQPGLIEAVNAGTPFDISRLQSPQYQISPYALLFSFGDVVYLIVYLWWPPLQRWLGRYFLPVGLAIATLGPILGQHLSTAWFTATDVFVLAGAWQLVVVLFLPLVLMAWQYDFHWVLRFSAGTALLDVGLTLLAASAGSWAGIHLLLSIISMRTVLYIIVGYMITRLVTAQREQRQALGQANTRLTHYAGTLEQLSISRERNRLARELHDTLAHTLSGLAVQLEAVDAAWETNSTVAHTLLEQSITATRSGLTETRRALRALRASPLEDLGLSLAIRHLAESLAGRTGLSLDLRLPDDQDNLSPPVEQCVYRVAQESLANIDRHAGARRVGVRLEHTNHHLTLTIVDDGQGFGPDNANTENHFGLKGMEERAAMVGGTLKVETQPGAGTSICLTVPTEIKKSEPEQNSG
jgi:signal transduction histidine kinase